MYYLIAIAKHSPSTPCPDLSQNHSLILMLGHYAQKSAIILKGLPI